MKTWDYMYVYSKDDKWTDVECYEQPWWRILRAELYHRYICMRSDSYEADMRCYAYHQSRREHIHTFRVADNV